MRTALLALALAAPAALAQPADPVAATLAPALYDAALGESLDVIEQTFADPSDPASLVFSRERMASRVLALYAERATRDEAEAFAAWTRRPDVAPFLARERETGSAAFEETVDRYFEAKTPTEADVIRTERLLDAMGYPAYAAQIGVRTVSLLGLLMAADAGDEVTRERYDGGIGEVDASEGGEMYEAALAQLVDVYVVAYADASSGELARFQKAVQLPAAQWYYRTMPEVMLAAFDEAALAYLRASTD